jgi:hypothetical protein
MQNCLEFRSFGKAAQAVREDIPAVMMKGLPVLVPPNIRQKTADPAAEQSFAAAIHELKGRCLQSSAVAVRWWAFHKMLMVPAEGTHSVWGFQELRNFAQKTGSCLVLTDLK